MIENIYKDIVGDIYRYILGDVYRYMVGFYTYITNNIYKYLALLYLKWSLAPNAAIVISACLFEGYSLDTNQMIVRCLIKIQIHV